MLDAGHTGSLSVMQETFLLDDMASNLNCVELHSLLPFPTALHHSWGSLCCLADARAFAPTGNQSINHHSCHDSCRVAPGILLPAEISGHGRISLTAPTRSMCCKRSASIYRLPCHQSKTTLSHWLKTKSDEPTVGNQASKTLRSEPVDTTHQAEPQTLTEAFGDELAS